MLAYNNLTHYIKAAALTLALQFEVNKLENHL